jgi:hypothetical protein
MKNIEVKKLNKIILDPNTNIIRNFDYFETPFDEFWKIFNSLLNCFIPWQFKDISATRKFRI